MNKKFDSSSLITLAIVVFVLVIAAYFAYQALSNNEQAAIEASPAGAALLAPERAGSFTDIDGEPVSLNDYLGKVLVVNSWASWSPQSAQELATLAELTDLFVENDVVVLAINRAEPKETAQAFLRSLAVTDSVVLLLDAEDTFYQNIGGYAMPETLFYDTEGNIIFHKRGPLQSSEIVQYTNAAVEASKAE